MSHCATRSAVQGRLQGATEWAETSLVRSSYLLEADFHSPLTEAATADVDAVLADEACAEDTAGES